MSETLNITLIQSALHWEDRKANLAMFGEKIAALKSPSDLILLPEMFSTGFTMNAGPLAESMDGNAIDWMRKTAEKHQCAIAGSLIIRDAIPGQKGSVGFFNRLIWMRPDGSFNQYDKRHLFRLASEQITYTPGKEKVIVSLKGWRILPLICFDLRFPVWSRRTKKSDYDLLIYVANWPERRVIAWNQLLIARAIENQCYVAGVNRVGPDGNSIHHSGESAVVNFKGEVISGLIPNEECSETLSLEKAPLERFRKQLPFLEDADDFTVNS